MRQLYFILLFLFCILKHSFALSLGDGSDGSPSISGVVNSYTEVTNITDSNCTSQITVASASSFQVNDLILIIQMEGATIDNTNTASYGIITSAGTAGVYEFSIVQSISGNVITINALQYSYDVNSKTQLVNVPQYQSPTVTGTLTCQAWNGTTGGILAIDVSGTITFNNDINVSAKGFRGGLTDYAVTSGVHLIDYVANNNPSNYSEKGEGIAGYGVGTQVYGRGAPANGAGGGNAVNAGGGGGAGYGCGGLGGWGYDHPGFGPNITDPQGIGGYALPFSQSSNLIFMGGGGGAGHNNDFQGTNGGIGGGIVIISCNSLDGNSHNFHADGADALTPGIDGAGGGGGAGVILLSVEIYLSNINISTIGGDGGDAVLSGSGYSHGPGGGGGGGLIWVKQSSLPAQVIVSGINGGIGGIVAGVNHGTTDGCDGSTYFDLQIPFSNIIGGGSSFTSVSICNGDSINLNAANGSNYLWAPVNGLSCTTCQNTVANPNATTIYTVQYQNGGCNVIDSFQVIVNVLPSLQVSADTVICGGGSVQLQALSGDPVVWSPSVGLTCTSCYNPTASPLSTTTYFVTANNGNCSVTDSVTVNVFSSQLISVSSDVEICVGDSVQLSASGFGNISWTPASTLSCDTCNDPMAFPLVTTSYYVTFSITGCSITDSIVVSVLPFPALQISNDTSICFGSLLQLFASSTYPVTWNSSPFLSCTSCYDPFANPNSTTTFIATASNGPCSVYDSVTVEVIIFSVDAGSDTVIVEGQSVMLNGTGAQSYQWSPSSSLSDSSVANPVASPDKTTTYVLTGTSADGCIGTDTVNIRVISACDGVFIPSAFSPNDDGINDKFGIISIAGITLNSFRIFNRWGQVIFQTNDLNEGWDGMYKGSKEEIGVYVYVIEINCGEVKHIIGNLTLVR